MQRRCFFTSAVLAVILAACGGDDFTSTGSGGAAASSGGGSSDGGSGGGPTSASAGGAGAGPIGTCTNAAEVCLEKPSGSWQGPVVVSIGPGDSPPAACQGDWNQPELNGFAGEPMGSVECSDCSCDAPAGGGCAPPMVTAYTGNGCTGTTSTKVPDPNGACTSIGTSTFAVIAAPSAVLPGQCVAHGGAATPTPVTWEATVLLCGGAEPGQECADGAGACFPAPDAPFAARVCVYTEDPDPTCPAGFPDLQRLHQGLSDSRGCTECDCGPEQNAVCIGSLLAFGLNQCATGATAVPTDGATCKSMVGSPFTNLDWTDEPRTAGTCPTSGGQPKGELSGEGDVTLCCTPEL
jgi:hypothetical protein